MKGTRLWYEVGSPLIHGRTRARGGLLPGWIAGSLVSGIACAGGLAGVLYLSDMLRPSLYVHVSAVAGACVVGSLVGSWFARRGGSPSAWISGAVMGVIFGTAALIVVLIKFI